MSQPHDYITFNRGEVIYDTRVSLSYAFFVLKGRVELEVDLNNKKIRYEVEENNFLGDAGVIIGSKLGSEMHSFRGRAIALEETTLSLIKIEEIQEALDQSPLLIKAWISSYTLKSLAVIQQLIQVSDENQ